MKSIVHAVLALSLVLIHPAFAATKVAPAQAATGTPAHLKAVQDLLSAMQVEKVLRRVAYRSHYENDKQRQAVIARIETTPAVEVHRRLAPSLARFISADTAIEMTRYYSTPYGKQVVYRKYNSGAQLIVPGATRGVAAAEKKERKRPAYVKASKELAEAEQLFEHEAFKLLQKINAEKR